jgi:ABC-type spermidine/putrescine transport system permease subunit II
LVDYAFRTLGRLVVIAVTLFMLTPAVLVVVLSFSGDAVIRFPPTSWGLRQYHGLLQSPEWMDAIKTSFLVGLPTAALAVAIGLPAIYAARRTSLPGGDAMLLAGISGMIIPSSTYAVAMYGVFAGLGLVGTFPGLVLAHAVLAVPLVLLVVGTAILRIPKELELVAMGLGASRVRAWLGITARLLSPAILVSLILAFLASFDEAVFATFLGGPHVTTLPRAIFNSVRFSVDPVVTAIATLLIAGTALLVALTVAFRKNNDVR